MTIGFLFVPPASTGDRWAAVSSVPTDLTYLAPATLFTWAASLQFATRKWNENPAQSSHCRQGMCSLSFLPLWCHFLPHSCSLKSATDSSLSSSLSGHFESQLTPRLPHDLFLSWCSLSLSDYKLPRVKDCNLFIGMRQHSLFCEVNLDFLFLSICA